MKKIKELEGISTRSVKECLRGIRDFSRPLRAGMAVSVAIGLVRIAASLAFVWICKRLVDIATGDLSAPFGPSAVLMVLIMLTQVFAGLATSWWSGRLSVRCQNGLRYRIFNSVLESGWSGRESFLSGDAVNRLQEDVRVVTELIADRIPGFIITIVQLLAASVYLAILAPGLLWVLLVLMVVAVLGSKMCFKVLRRLTMSIRKGEGEAQQLMQENILNRVLVLTLIGVERVLGRLKKTQDKIEDDTVSRLNYNALARGFMNLGFMAGYAAAFLWGVLGIKAGTVTYGTMTAFLQLVGQVQRPIAEAGRQIPAFIHALASVERLMELDSLPGRAKGETVKLEKAPGIEVSDITFAYPGADKPVLKDFSCSFKAGGITSISGETGIGKSTLIRLILGLLSPEKGEIKIGGIPAGPGLTGNFMYVPQGNSLLSGTVRTNLLLARPDAGEEDMSRVLDLACAGFVKDLPEGLDTPCGEVGSGLSEGQCQRIAIARALLHEGSVLILDEATSALDGETEKALLENIAAFCRARKTVICISHREAAIRIADEVIKL